MDKPKIKDIYREPEVGDVYWDEWMQDFYKITGWDDPNFIVHYSSGLHDNQPRDMIVHYIRNVEDILATEKQWMAARIKA